MEDDLILGNYLIYEVSMFAPMFYFEILHAD